MWFGLCTASLVLLMVWGIPEIIVRIANPQLESYRAILFGNDPNSPQLFMKDARLHWKLRPAVEADFVQVTVRTDRNGFRGREPQPNRRTVLCLGDSTVFGYRVEESDSFPGRLQARLDSEDDSGGGWRVINAGVPGYTSFQVRLLAERLVPRWRPDVIVVCVGNNEAWPVNTSDRQIDSDRATAARLTGLFSASRFLVWASETVRSEKPQPFVAPALDSAVPRVSPEEFADNLRAIAQLARAANAQLILLSPPVNLYWQPMRTDLFPEWKQWEAFCESIRKLWNAGERQKAVEMVNARFAEEPDSFFGLWIKGIVLTDTGDVAGGRELLEQAIENHPFPENCKRSYRDVIAQVAQEEQVPLVNVNELFVARTAAPTPQGLYIDWCHPTPQGNGIIASAIFEIMANDKD